MYARYNSFNKLELPIFTLCYPGATYTNGALTNVIGNLATTSDEELSVNFNALSELSLRAYSVPASLQSTTDSEHIWKYKEIYKKIDSKLLIFINGFGFFQITECETVFSDGKDYKDIRAESCEAEFQNKALPYIEDNTYNFSALLETLLKQMPLWVIGNVDSSVANKYRYFEDVSTDSNILSFMLEDMQDAYECIFLFDTINRQVNVYDQNNYVVQTDIHLSRESLIQSLNVTSNSDDLYTAIRAEGDDDIYISPVNPLGSNVLYDFSYYLNWMSDGLKTKVQEWQSMVDYWSTAPDVILSSGDDYPENPTDGEIVYFRGDLDVGDFGYAEQYDKDSDWVSIELPYYCRNLVYYQYLEKKSNTTAEISKLEIQIDLYKRCRDNIVAESGMPADKLGYSVGGTSVIQLSNMITNYSTYIVSNGGDSIPIKRSYIDSLSVTDNAAQTTYTAVGDAGKEITALYVKGKDGIYLRQLTQVESESSLTLGTFLYDPVLKTLYFYLGELEDGTEIAVFYSQEDSTSAQSEEVILITDLLESVDGLLAIAQNNKLVQETLLSNIQEYMQGVNSLIDEVRHYCSMTEYFTDDELSELANYVFEGSYSDDYVVITDIMNYEEQFEQIKLLYDRTKSQLKRVCVPTEEFNVDTESFIFTDVFEDWTEQLETGCIINVETEQNSVSQLFLSSFTVNYDDKKFSMKFGNRYNKFDPKSLFEDTLGKISKTSNTLDFVKEAIYPIKQGGQLDQMQKELSESRTLTAGAALSSTDNKIVIDETGYTGRRIVENGEYDPEQIKIVNNQIVLTDDAWKSCKVAIGKMTIGDDDSVYGVNAEVLMGDLIVGKSLKIVQEDEDGNLKDVFTVINNNITAAVDEIHAITTTTGFTFNEEGLTISKEGSGSTINKINEEGMRVLYVKPTTDSESSSTENIMLEATSQGVKAANLEATTFLVVGKHARFENYKTSDDDNRVGCFYI